LNSDFFGVAETYALACGAASAEAKRVERLKRVFREYLPVKRDSLTMEVAFSLLFMAKDFPQIYSGTRGRRRAPGDSQEIEDFLCLTFDILTLLDRADRADTLYDTLAAVLRPHDAVVTLNYDTLFDSALVRKGWDPRRGYGVSGAADKFRWYPRFTNPDLDNVRLLKLHGSLNWYVKGSFSDLSAVFQKKPTRIERPRRNEIGGYIRQIVPPIYGKFFGHDHWQSLWLMAYRALRQAEVLIVIGCSLVDIDFHLRALVGRVARWRKKDQNPFRRLVLVDRVGVRRRWARALKGAYVRQGGYRTFSAFMRREVKV